MSKNDFDRFSTAVEKIEPAIAGRLAKNNDSNRGDRDNLSALIDKAFEKRWIGKDEKDFLHSCRKLRNATRHGGNGDVDFLNKYLSIDKNLFDGLAAISLKLNKGAKAEDIAIKETSVFKCQMHDDLLTVIKSMRANNFTHVPILDDNKVVIGILSDDSILNRAVQENIIEIDDSTKVSDYKEYVDLYKNRAEEFKFISRDMPLGEIDDIFSDYLAQKKRLSLMLMTQAGKSDQALLGIVTIWDMYQ